MSTEAMFHRFVERTPVTVMVRATLENLFSAQVVDQIFAESAERQRPSGLLFSSVVDLLSLVVFRQRRSINEAYPGRRRETTAWLTFADFLAFAD